MLSRAKSLCVLLCSLFLLAIMFVIVLCALYLQIPWNLLSESAFRSLVSSTQQASLPVPVHEAQVPVQVPVLN